MCIRDRLYTLSTPELNAKLQQAEAVKSAASAMDQKALTGARIQQKEAALNLWEKAQAGLLLAQKTFDRVNNLYEQGVVPAQKLDDCLLYTSRLAQTIPLGQVGRGVGIRWEDPVIPRYNGQRMQSVMCSPAPGVERCV